MNQEVRKKTKKYAFLLILVSCFLLLASHKTYAAGYSLGIYPPIIQIIATPPARFTTPLTIQNQSDTTTNLVPVFKPFTASGANNGTLSYLPNNRILSPDPNLFDKVKLTNNSHEITSLTLAPKQQRTLTLSVDLPKDEPLSDYYFSIVFTAQNTTNGTSTTAQTPIGIASNVLLSIGPKGQASAEIAKFTTSPFFTNGPVPFTVLIKNTGEHVIAPFGQIIIYNMLNQPIGKVDLTPVNILSGTSRYIPDITQTQVTSPQAIWPTHVLLGPYTAKLSIFVTNQGPVLTKSIHFFALPLPVLIGAFLLILLGLIIAERVQKRLREKA